jgi:DNA-binding MarR family transcriptional regulator
MECMFKAKLSFVSYRAHERNARRAKTVKVEMKEKETPATVSRPELLRDGSDAAFRQMLNDLFAFSRSLESARAKFAEAVGLSSTQYMILITISRNRETEGFGVNRIAAALHLSGSFVTNEINKLVEASLVKKITDPIDRRRVQLQVTRNGERKVAQLASFQRPVNDVLFESLTARQFDQLSEILSVLVKNGDRGVRLAASIPDWLEAGGLGGSR